MLRNRNTKIIATLGPSSSAPLKIHSLFQAGADISDDEAKRVYDGFSQTIKKELHPTLFHKRGTLNAARTGDEVNPEQRSSGTHFTIIQGKVFDDEGLGFVFDHMIVFLSIQFLSCSMMTTR